MFIVTFLGGKGKENEKEERKRMPERVGMYMSSCGGSLLYTTHIKRERKSHTVYIVLR